jgi:hypothetical protein
VELLDRIERRKGKSTDFFGRKKLPMLLSSCSNPAIWTNSARFQLPTLVATPSIAIAIAIAPR